MRSSVIQQMVLTFVGAGSLMAIHRYSDHQFPPNSKVHNSLKCLNPPNAFLGNSADGPNFCRGGFSHGNAPLFGSAISAEQQGSQQLEGPKPAHSGKHKSFTD